MAAQLTAIERSFGPRAMSVDGTRDELLPGAAFAGDENGRFRVAHATDRGRTRAAWPGSDPGNFRDGAWAATTDLSEAAVPLR